MELPKSKLTKSQSKTFYREIAESKKAKIKIQYDDACNNGHNTFSITADTWEWDKKNPYIENSSSYGWVSAGFGCCHEFIKEVAPDLAKYIKWHLTSSDGPMHYLANTLYHLSEKNCWGYRKGEIKNITFPTIEEGTYKSSLDNKITSFKRFGQGFAKVVPGNATLKEDEIIKLINKECENKKVNSKYSKYAWLPNWYFLEYEEEGKIPDLDAARYSAVWPEATDEILFAKDIEDKLKKRLPALMQEFKRDMEELGFVY